MAQPKRRMQATGQPHSVIDAPKYIAGVPGKKIRSQMLRETVKNARAFWTAPSVWERRPHDSTK